MATFLSPGIKQYEQPSAIQQPSGVSTSICSFIGLAPKGQIGVRKYITSWEQYVSVYGAFEAYSYMAYTVYNFFQNGGKACYIVRIGHYSDITAGTLDSSDNIKAFKAFNDQNTTPQEAFTLKAINEGTWGNSVSANISKAISSLASFFKVLYDDGGAFGDNTDFAKAASLTYALVRDASAGSIQDQTSKARTAGGGAAFECFTTDGHHGDTLFIGSEEGKFSKMFFDIETAGAGAGVAVLQYWNGTSWQTLTPLVDNITSGGITFGAAAADNLEVSFTTPSNWRKRLINGKYAYWVRYRVTTAYTTTKPKIDRISLDVDKPFGLFTPVASSSVEVASSVSVDDSAYFGAKVPFKYLKSILLTNGAGGTPDVEWEYWNGNNWAVLSNVTETATNAKKFMASGILGWDVPSDWKKTTVDDSDLYWVRARCTAVYSSAQPVAERVVPSPYLFDLEVLFKGIVVERFLDCSMDSTSSNAVEKLIGDGSEDNQKSAYVYVVKNVSQTTISPSNLPEEVSGIFLSGGKYDTSNIVDNDYIGSSASRVGLYALDGEKNVSILTVPGVTTEPVHQAMISYCENRKDIFTILDLSDIDPEALVEYCTEIGAFNSSYACYFDNWIKVADPASISGAIKKVPNSGFYAGALARTDDTRGTHKAAAGIIDGRMNGALGVSYQTNEAERDLLYPNKINPIIDKPGYGVLFFGSRTSAPVGSDWDQVPVRRLFMEVREVIDNATQFALFEPIDDDLFIKLRSTIGNYLLQKWRGGALRGKTPQEAFFIVCDETNNPPSQQNAGMVKVRTGLAVKKPAQFIEETFEVDVRAIQAELAAAGIV